MVSKAVITRELQGVSLLTSLQQNEEVTSIEDPSRGLLKVLMPSATNMTLAILAHSNKINT